MTLTVAASPALENIISSYEAGVANVSSLLDATHLVFNGLQESFQTARQERAEINTRLSDTLSHNEHLRKKDFDRMMQGILALQEARESETKNLLNGYIGEQREMADTLRRNLEKFRRSLAVGEAQRFNEFQELNKAMLARQDQRRENITAKLKEFQEEQHALAAKFRALLIKGRELRITDLRAMLGEFREKRLSTVRGRRHDDKNRAASANAAEKVAQKGAENGTGE